MRVSKANKVLRKGVLQILSLFIITIGYSQVPEIIWSKTFGGSESDVGRYVQITNDGGFILTGNSSSFSGSSIDVYVVKTDEFGDEQWSQSYGGENEDYGFSVQITSDGGYIVAGYTNSFGAGGWDAYLIKLDQNGTEEWSETYGETEDDKVHDVQQTADGGYVMAGSTKSFGVGNWDYYIVKTDSQGNEEWTKTFGEDSNDECYSIQLTSDGGYIVAGYSSDGEGDFDSYIVKIDDQGNEQWSQTYGGELYSEGRYVEQTSDNGYIVTGIVAASVSPWDIFCLK